MSVVFGIFVFLVLIMLTAVLFGAWVLLLIGRFFVRLLGGPPSRYPAAPPAPQGKLRCSNERCLAVNPVDARYCRRCGRGLRAAHLAA